MSALLPGRFPGGLWLDGQREMAAPPALTPVPLPDLLLFPLRRRDGRDAAPRVVAGACVRRGEIIAGGETTLDPPILASTSGRVRAIAPRPLPVPNGGLGQCILLEPDGEDRGLEPEPWAEWWQRSPEAVLARIHAAGIVGLGGAGFPAAAKLADGRGRVDTLILNGVECEPYLSCDQTLLTREAPAVLGGAAILRWLTGAGEVLIAIESDRGEALAAVTRGLAEGRHSGMRLVAVPPRYPAGGERQLIQTLTGREVPAGQHPSAIGILCQNVATAAAIHQAVTGGMPLVSRIVTVAGGGVRRSGNLLVRLGTPVADLVACLGGYADLPERLILGGPLTGFAVATDRVPITAAVNGVLVGAGGQFGERPEVLPCIRCGTCAEVCPASLLPQELHRQCRIDGLDAALDLGLPACIECGCCDVVCPSHIPLTAGFRTAKSAVAARQRQRDKADQARLRYEARQARKQREQEESAEAARRRRDNLARGAAPEIRQAIERARRKRLERQRVEAGDEAPEGEPSQ